MPLDPQAKAVIDLFAAMPDLSSFEPAAARQLYALAAAVADPEPVAHVEDRTLPGPAGELPVRVYRPDAEGPLPVLVFFHGGGFVLCDLETHDNVCRRLANRAGCVVVSVDYRLAPEHPFPAAPEDCYAATCWVAEHGAGLGADPGRLAVGGDSAGGNLTAAVSLMARDRGGPTLCQQLLVYPVTNRDFDTPSYRENGEGYFLTTRTMQWFWGHYLSDDAHADDPYASPLRAAELAKLPPAHVVTAQYDPLRDEGEAYAARLRDAGVATTLRRYDGMFHGFFSMFEQIDAGRAAIDEAADALRAGFADAR